MAPSVLFNYMEIPLSFVHPRFLKRKDSVLTQATFSMERLKVILRLDAEDRSDKDLHELLSFVRGIKFFTELKEKAGESSLLQCCRKLKLETYPAGKVCTSQMVFTAGDRGDLFYIILSGSCAVLSNTSQMLALLRQGDSFGELALIANAPRAASVMCREACHFAVLSRLDYQSILATVQDRTLMEKVDLIARHPTFGRWKKEVLMRMSYFFKSRALRKMQVLFVANQPASDLYLIKDGFFHLSKSALLYPRGPAGKSVRKDIQITTVHGGEFLGLSQALENRPFDFTCTCGSNSAEVLIITKKNFMSFFENEGNAEALLAVEKDREVYRQRQAVATLHMKSESTVEDFLKKRHISKDNIELRRTTSMDFVSVPKRSHKFLHASLEARRHPNKSNKSRSKQYSEVNQSMLLPSVYKHHLNDSFAFQ